MAVIDTSVYLAAIDPAEPFHAGARHWMATDIAVGPKKNSATGCSPIAEQFESL